MEFFGGWKVDIFQWCKIFVWNFVNVSVDI